MIIAPLPTPFDGDHPDWSAFAELIAALEPYLDGLLLFGSNGEAVHLNPLEQRMGLLAVAPGVGKPFWVGTGAESLPQAAMLLEQAAEAGAMAALVTPPRYFTRTMSKEAYLRYYRGLADLDALPVWLYHVPQLTHADLGLEVVRELAMHDNIQGLKDSSGELERMAYYQSEALTLRLFTGHAPTFLGALALGAEGGILAAANLAPMAYQKLLEAWQAGNITEAQAWQEKLFPFGRMLAKGGFILLKQALRYLGLPAGFPRPPYDQTSPHWPDSLPILEALRSEGLVVG